MSAYFFKTLTQNDSTTSRTLLHESVPITGTLVSGTYEVTSAEREVNIKTYSHGMFQSVYDYPYQSSSANHIFDITTGYHSASAQRGANSASYGALGVQDAKKLNIYSQMAQVLVGYDTNGNIRKFDFDGDHDDSANKKDSLVFFNFSRLLVKDEIKKGSFSMTFNTGSDPNTPSSGSATQPGGHVTLSDTSAKTNYRANSPAGEYGFLKSSNTGLTAGLVYYQAGIACVDSTLFSVNVRDDHVAGSDKSAPIIMHSGSTAQAEGQTHNNTWDHNDLFRSGTIDQAADAYRNRLHSISFNNTTELNSTIYFCRAHQSEFNYSSNPTYLSGSKIRIKTDTGTNEFANPPMSYVTTVGLYSPDNELLAVAKLSEPIKKTPVNELNFRVRLDF